MSQKSSVIKRWFIFCEPCSYRQIIIGDKPEAENLVEIKTSPIPGGSPVLDSKTKKAKAKPDIPRSKKFKCPQCGRGVMAKKLPDVHANAYKAVDDARRKREEESEKQKRLNDGKPHVRESDPDFLG